MTDITRRQFLKGLCSAAGLVAVPELPYLDPKTTPKDVDLSLVPHAILEVCGWQLPIWQASLELYKPHYVAYYDDGIPHYKRLPGLDWTMAFDLRSAPMSILGISAMTPFDFRVWPPLCAVTFSGTAHHADLSIGHSTELTNNHILGYGDVINVVLYGHNELEVLESPMVLRQIAPSTVA